MEKTAVNAVSAHLLLLVVNTRGGSVEEVSRVGTAGGLEHVHGDRSIVVGEDRLVGLNKAHSTHVSRKVVNVLAVLARGNSNIELAKVTEDELRTKVRFLHELVLDPVNADLRGIERMIEANKGNVG